MIFPTAVALQWDNPVEPRSLQPLCELNRSFRSRSIQTLYASQTDAELWDALHRSFLVESPKADEDGTHTPTSRFNLETVIDSEGSNLSVGERSLLSLARALVKDSQIVGE